jgi:hypothetical protein
MPNNGRKLSHLLSWHLTSNKIVVLSCNTMENPKGLAEDSLESWKLYSSKLDIKGCKQFSTLKD